MTKLEIKRKFKGVWIPKEVWLDHSLSLVEKALLVEIDSLDNADGCFASNKYFSQFFNIGERQIKNHIRSLKEKEMISLQMVGRNKRILRVIYFPQPGKEIALIEGKKLPHNNKDNNTNTDTASASPNAPLSTKDYIEKMLESPRENIQIIGIYADELYRVKRIKGWKTADQAREFVKRNLRVAQGLVPYGVGDVRIAIQKMLKREIKGQPMEFTLETVAKHIDDPKYGGN